MTFVVTQGFLDHFGLEIASATCRASPSCAPRACSTTGRARAPLRGGRRSRDEGGSEDAAEPSFSEAAGTAGGQFGARRDQAIENSAPFC